MRGWGRWGCVLMLDGLFGFSLLFILSVIVSCWGKG